MSEEEKRDKKTTNSFAAISGKKHKIEELMPESKIRIIS